MDKKKYRLQFDFSKDALDRFDTLVGETDASSRVEVLRNALYIYEWLIQRAKQGGALQLSNDELRVIVKSRTS